MAAHRLALFALVVLIVFVALAQSAPKPSKPGKKKHFGLVPKINKMKVLPNEVKAKIKFPKYKQVTRMATGGALGVAPHVGKGKTLPKVMRAKVNKAEILPTYLKMKRKSSGSKHAQKASLTKHKSAAFSKKSLKSILRGGKKKPAKKGAAVKRQTGKKGKSKPCSKPSPGVEPVPMVKKKIKVPSTNSEEAHGVVTLLESKSPTAKRCGVPVKAPQPKKMQPKKKVKVGKPQRSIEKKVKIHKVTPQIKKVAKFRKTKPKCGPAGKGTLPGKKGMCGKKKQKTKTIKKLKKLEREKKVVKAKPKIKSKRESIKAKIQKKSTIHKKKRKCSPASKGTKPGKKGTCGYKAKNEGKRSKLTVEVKGAKKNGSGVVPVIITDNEVRNSTKPKIDKPKTEAEKLAGLLMKTKKKKGVKLAGSGMNDIQPEVVVMPKVGNLKSPTSSKKGKPEKHLTLKPAKKKPIRKKGKPVIVHPIVKDKKKSKSALDALDESILDEALQFDKNKKVAAKNGTTARPSRKAKKGEKTTPKQNVVSSNKKAPPIKRDTSKVKPFAREATPLVKKVIEPVLRTTKPRKSRRDELHTHPLYKKAVRIKKKIFSIVKSYIKTMKGVTPMKIKRKALVKPRSVSIQKIAKENGVIERKIGDIIPPKAVRKSK